MPRPSAAGQVDAARARTQTAQIAPAPPAFHWRQIETSDFREYLSNLRAVGCPEDVVQDLVGTELIRLYARRQARLPRPDDFWQPLEARRAADQRLAAQRRALRREQYAVMKELLGTYWTEEGYHLWYEDDFALIPEMLVGSFSDGKVLEAVSVFLDRDDYVRGAEEDCQDPGPEGRRACRLAAGERWLQALAEPLTSAGLEELQARGVMIDDLKVRYLEELKLRPNELRDIARLRAASFSPLLEHLDLDDEEPSDQKTQRFDADLRNYLGAERYAVWQRRQDDDYQQLRQLTDQTVLPRDSVVRAWEIWKAAQVNAAQLAGGEVAASASIKAARAELSLQTEAALTDLLGDGCTAEFLKRRTGWAGTPQ